MKHQELFDELLKSKLKDFESEPPAFAFDKIAQELNQKPVRKLTPLWRSHKVAAAIAMLMVSGAVYWVNFSSVAPNGNQLAMPTENNQQIEALTEQLDKLEQKAQQLAQALEEKKSNTMQPANNTVRLSTKLTNDKVEQEQTPERMQIVAPITPRQAVARQLSRSTPDLMAATFERYPQADQPTTEELPLQAGSSSAIVNTFSKLTSGAYLNLAKNKVNEFVTKEHYVNFAIGNVEFGQTIQLSK